MYYEIIERPTDLQTISQKLCKHKFTTLDEFKAEVRARVVSPVGLGACGAFVVCPGHHLGLFLFFVHPASHPSLQGHADILQLPHL